MSNTITATMKPIDDASGQAAAVAPTVPDPVNPPHYRGDRVMCIIEEFALDFRLGNVVKYILRAEMKGGTVDLEKARWYLDREIAARKVRKETP